MTANDSEFVGGLARGLSVLECFDKANSELTLSDVAKRTGLSPASVRRSLITLEKLGYVRRIGRTFFLSARVLTLGAVYLRSAQSEDLLLPELQRLVGLFGDSASVATLDRGKILYVAHYSEQRAKRMMATVGTTFPAYATSLGKVMLSGLSPDAFKAYLDHVSFERLTDRTILQQSALSACVDECRANGFATSVDELDYGITSLAVPVRNDQHKIVAALNCSAYTGRVSSAELIDQRLEELRESSFKVAQILQRHPALLHSLYPGVGPAS